MDKWNKKVLVYIKTMIIPTKAISFSSINILNTVTLKNMTIIIISILFSGLIQIIFSKIKNKENMYKYRLPDYVKIKDEQSRTDKLAKWLVEDKK